MAGRRARLAWAAVAVVLAIAAAVAALVPPRGTPGIEVADLGEALALLLHLVGYAALALTSILAQAHPRPVLTAVILVAYASALEVVQGAVGSRSFQAQDLAANAAGTALGIVLGILISRRLRARSCQTPATG